jgi:hypothetical protein
MNVGCDEGRVTALEGAGHTVVAVDASATMSCRPRRWITSGIAGSFSSPDMAPPTLIDREPIRR